MGTTPVFKVPYPEPSDPVANYPTTGQALANKVEAMAIPGAVNSTAWTAATGWSLNAGSCNVKAMGKLVLHQGTATRTGAALTVPATGDLSNVAVAQLNLAAIGGTTISFGGPISSSSAGRLAQFTINGTGALTLAAVAPGANIAVGEALSWSGMFFLA